MWPVGGMAFEFELEYLSLFESIFETVFSSELGELQIRGLFYETKIELKKFMLLCIKNNNLLMLFFNTS